MGNCAMAKKNNPVKSLQQDTKLKKSEKGLLGLMYRDLATRSHTNKLTRENFDIVFHLNGLWGQEIFNCFDVKKLGYLQSIEFESGIELLVKSSLKQKVHALFKFYDIHKTNGVSYQELLKMLYSYPKQQLKKMIDDEKFLNAMNLHQRYYHFGSHKILDDNREVVQQLSQQYESQKNLNLNEKEKRSSDATRDQQRSPQKKARMNSVDFLSSKDLENQIQSIEKKAASSPYINSIAKFKICSNLSLIVKKYATFLFKEFQLNKDTDQLSEAQFNNLIEKHQKLFTSYLEGFHTYIWEVNTQNIPLSKYQKSWIESECEQIDIKTNTISKRYIKFARMTLFIYASKHDIFPCDLKNFEGLHIQRINLEVGGISRFGFIIKHRDGIYPEKIYTFESQVLQEEWLINLKDFKHNSVYDLYKLTQKIGTGNFSIVYKGVERATLKEVAIKVIQIQKLEQHEKNVIKHQCEILALCYHPNIIKFKAKLQTKTHLYIVTQYLNEGGLEEYIQQKSYLSEYEACLIMKQLIDTIIYLNSLGLIHRDLKPQNIMIRLNKQKKRVEKVKIIDFGFAIYKDSLKNLKGNEKFAGTPGFLAPEVIKMQEYDEKVDNFSLGVILYFMLSGILPFDSPCDDEIIKFTLRCNIRLQNAHWANISTNGKDFVKRLLTHKENRITLEQALRHPWITESQDLLAMEEHLEWDFNKNQNQNLVRKSL